MSMEDSYAATFSITDLLKLFCFLPYTAWGSQRQNKSRDANQNDNALNLATDELGKVDISDEKAY